MANGQPNPRGDPRKSRIVHLLFFLLLLPVVQTCDLHYYYDLGTKLCEFCCDICCASDIKGTSLQCEEDCPKYAQKQREEAAQQLLDDGQNLGDDGRTGQSRDSGQSGFSLAAKIGIPVASCVVVAVLLIIIIGLVFISRRGQALARKNASKGVQPASPHEAEAVCPTETKPLRAQPSLSQDIPLRIIDEENQELLDIQESGDESGESPALTIVDEANQELLDIQESGGESGESLEERSREGFGVGFGGTIASAAEAFGESSAETGFFEGAPDLSDLSMVQQTASYTPQLSDGRPYQESVDGHRGHMEFAPNEGNPLKSDDTERKTLASSAPLGMVTTRV